MINQFIRKFKRAISFFIFGWNNYDFDWVYLLEAIQFKLKRLEKEILKGYNADPKKELQSIRICLKLIHQIITNPYDCHHKLHLKRWGCEYSPDVHKSLPFEVYTCAKVTHENRDEYVADFREAYDKDDARRQKDIDLLFKVMAKYIQYWWD